MVISYHNGCSSSSCPGICISSEFVWYSNDFVRYCVWLLDADFISAFYLRYLL